MLMMRRIGPVQRPLRPVTQEDPMLTSLTLVTLLVCWLLLGTLARAR